MDVTVNLFPDGDYAFSGRAFDITKAKNNALKQYHKQVLNYGWTFMILPDHDAREQINRTIGCARVVRNNYLDARIRAYQDNKETLFVSSYKANGLKQLKEERPYLKDVDKFALESAIEHVDAAYKNFFDGRAAFPKFASKYKPNGNVYTTKSTNNNIRIEKKDSIAIITLPRVGAVPIVIPKGMRIKDLMRPGLHILKATVRHTGNDYYVSVGFETVIDEITPVREVNVSDIIAMDMGIKDFCHYGNRGGTITVTNPRWIRLHARRLRRFQKALSRKQFDQKTHTGSVNYYKALAKVRKEQAKTRNQRKDFQHKLSTDIASICKVFVCEDLNIKGMMKNRRLAKEIASVGWGEFLEKVRYKIERRGGRFLKVGRFFPSSQMCSHCGKKNPTVKDLKIRAWTCPSCGTYHDRDDNAVLNMINEAVIMLSEDEVAVAA